MSEISQSIQYTGQVKASFTSQIAAKNNLHHHVLGHDQEENVVCSQQRNANTDERKEILPSHVFFLSVCTA